MNIFDASAAPSWSFQSRCSAGVCVPARRNLFKGRGDAIPVCFQCHHSGRLHPLARISRLQEAAFMFRNIVTVLPLIAAIVAITIRQPPAVRLGAVSVIVLCFVLGLGGLIAPHRLAEESAGSPRSSEWQQGARDTRDVGYFFMPI